MSERLSTLKQFGPGIWTADGPDVVAMLGFQYPTRMAVLKLSSGKLFIWSPVALTDDLRSDVDAVGEVCYLIAPNSLHHLFVGDWKRAYPNARLYAAPGLRAKRKDIAFDDDLGDALVSYWAAEIDQVVVEGNAITREVVFFHRASATVIFTDLVQQLPKNWFSGWRALVAGWDLMLRPEPTVPRKFRLAFKDRHAARDSLQRIMAWPSEKVLMAHGTPVVANGRAFIQKAFNWLK